VGYAKAVLSNIVKNRDRKTTVGKKKERKKLVHQV